MSTSTMSQAFYKAHETAYKYRSGVIPEAVVGATVEKAEYTEEEGFDIWYTGMKYPTHGIFDPYAQAAADPVKRYLRNELKFTSHHPTRALAYFNPRFRKEWLEEFKRYCYMNFRGFVYHPQHWTRAVKEIYKATFILPIEFREAIAVVLEHDKPYRFRVQDVLGTLNKEALTKNPRKEIKRLLNLLTKRDYARDWKTISKLLMFALYVPKVKKTVVNILNTIDPIAISMDTADLYGSLLNGMESEEGRYHFMGLNNEAMIKLHMSL